MAIYKKLKYYIYNIYYSYENMSASDASATVSVIETSKKKSITVTTTNGGKMKDFKKGLPHFEVLGIPIEVDELATNNIQSLLDHKTKSICAQFPNSVSPLLTEDTSSSIEGFGWPGFDIKRVCEIFPGCLHEFATKKGTTRSDYICSATLIINNVSYFFTAKTVGNYCPPRPGVGMIDPQFIPDGSDKAISEMSPEERDEFHPRAKLCRQILAKLQELGY